LGDSGKLNFSLYIKADNILMKYFTLVFISLFSLTQPIFASESSVAIDDTLTAESFSLTEYKGKVVYLDFWASWCIPCRQSFPWLNTIRAKYRPNELVIIAVNLDKEHALALDFLKNYPADFQILYDPKAVLAKKFQIPGMPSSLLFDKNGQVVSAHTGFFRKKIPDYEAELAKLISVN
jgi:thiol-disulfide isomerase/thioredoxin